MSAIGIIIGKKHDELWQRIDAAGNPIEPTPSDFNAHPAFGGIVDSIIDDQHMVLVPQFHYRSGIVEAGPYIGKKAVWVSDQPGDGFALHPAFRHAGADLDQFWMGKYQATLDGDLMGSQPGQKPVGRLDFPAMQDIAAARGPGWFMWDIYQRGALQMLALIEHATPNLRSIVGDGYVDGNGLRPVDDALVAQAAYRGITGLWGNTWQMVAGLQTDANRQYLIWDKDGHRRFVETGAFAPESSGWFHKRHRNSGPDFDMGAVFVPKKNRDDDSKRGAYAGYSWNWANAVAYHGGNWGYGAICGLFCLNVSVAASSSYTSIGSRLAKV